MCTLEWSKIALRRILRPEIVVDNMNPACQFYCELKLISIFAQVVHLVHRGNLCKYQVFNYILDVA